MKIIVIQNKNEISKAMLNLVDDRLNILLQSEAFIGKNGITDKKIEGDKKTPKGYFSLGIAFGMHDIKTKLKYSRINEYLYWVDDINSKYYNKLVDIRKVSKDWISAEHLIKYKNEYEYGIEIKTNPKNIKGLGSAIFLHCTSGKPTSGCIAIRKEEMLKILSLINKNTNIIIM